MSSGGTTTAATGGGAGATAAAGHQQQHSSIGDQPKGGGGGGDPSYNNKTGGKSGSNNSNPNSGASKNNKGKGGRSHGRGGRGGNKGGGGADRESRAGSSNDTGNGGRRPAAGDNGEYFNDNRKKRPDVQHYKPGAFNSTKSNKSEETQSSGGGHDGYGEKETSQLNNNQKNKSKPSGDQHNPMEKSSAQQPNLEDQRSASGYPLSKSCSSTGGEGRPFNNSGNNNNKRSNRNKKPEQARYVPKPKSGGEEKQDPPQHQKEATTGGNNKPPMEDGAQGKSQLNPNVEGSSVSENNFSSGTNTSKGGKRNRNKKGQPKSGGGGGEESSSISKEETPPGMGKSDKRAPQQKPDVEVNGFSSSGGGGNKDQDINKSSGIESGNASGSSKRHSQKKGNNTAVPNENSNGSNNPGKDHHHQKKRHSGHNQADAPASSSGVPASRIRGGGSEHEHQQQPDESHSNEERKQSKGGSGSSNNKSGRRGAENSSKRPGGSGAGGKQQQQPQRQQQKNMANSHSGEGVEDPTASTPDSRQRKVSITHDVDSEVPDANIQNDPQRGNSRQSESRGKGGHGGRSMSPNSRNQKRTPSPESVGGGLDKKDGGGSRVYRRGSPPSSQGSNNNVPPRLQQQQQQRQPQSSTLAVQNSRYEENDQPPPRRGSTSRDNHYNNNPDPRERGGFRDSGSDWGKRYFREGGMNANQDQHQQQRLHQNQDNHHHQRYHHHSQQPRSWDSERRDRNDWQDHRGRGGGGHQSPPPHSQQGYGNSRYDRDLEYQHSSSRRGDLGGGGPQSKSSLPPRFQRAKESQQLFQEDDRNNPRSRRGVVDQQAGKRVIEGYRKFRDQPSSSDQSRQLQSHPTSGSGKQTHTGVGSSSGGGFGPRRNNASSYELSRSSSSSAGGDLHFKNKGGGSREFRDSASPPAFPTSPTTGKPIAVESFDGDEDDDDAQKMTCAPTSSKVDSSPAAVTDWSLEVEEEEQQLEEEAKRERIRKNSIRSIEERSHSGRGIIKIPPQHHHQPSREAWPTSQQEGKQPPPQQSTSSLNNPAWRGVAQPAEHTHPTASSSSSHHQRPPVFSDNPQTGHHHQNQRVLYDPKNPSKHIPASPFLPQSHPLPSENFARFPVDHGRNDGIPPRFHPSQSQPHPPAYRPPFPPSGSAGRHPTPPRGGMVPPSRMMNPLLQQLPPEWYDVKNVKIYGNLDSKKPKHDPATTTFILQNDLTLRQIMMEGGGKSICRLWDTKVAECRKNIQQAFEHLLKTDLLFCYEFDIEFHIWKIAFYQIVEVLKVCLKDDLPPEVRHTIQNNMSSLLTEGLDFYARMLETLDDSYHLDLNTYYDVLEPRPEDLNTQCALLSAQKCLLCLGDLARYKEQIEETSNFGKARQYYQQASNIEPRNGRPFNQLAILAMNTKRKFEAVYYNMRCLMSKNPFTSSQESLTVIFDEINRKWEAGERKRVEERRLASNLEKEGAHEKDRLAKGTRLRKEIWIRPEGGGRRLHRTTSAQEDANDNKEDEELKQMTTSDLNRRFITSFLYLIGKLFTKINMEVFPAALELLSKEFRILVSRSPLPIDSKRLVQIMALNMFVIERTRMLEASRAGDHQVYRGALQESALQLAFEMFSILVERCNELLQGFRPSLDSSSKQIFEDEGLPSLLSAVKVWCDWLLGNNETWYPIIVSEEPFHLFAKLATHLEKLKSILKPIQQQFLTVDEFSKKSRQEQDSYELVKLGEDSLLCGFKPWLIGFDWTVYRRYAPRSIPTALTQDARRLDAINFCVEFLEGLEPPVLKWSLPDNAHICLLPTHGSARGGKEGGGLKSSTGGGNLAELLAGKHDDVLEEIYSDEDEDFDDMRGNFKSMSMGRANEASSEFGAEDKLAKLKARKNELEKQRYGEERERRRMQRRILSEHVQVTLEVCPRFLVPDTNCFVDHLPALRQLSSSGHYQIRVPTVVLNELDGLAKGGIAGKYKSRDHENMVQENAKRGVAFLRERPPNTKCVTSKGTLLTSLTVTTEQDGEVGKNNDDLILEACYNIHHGRKQQHHQEEGRKAAGADGRKMLLLFRDVVLLTEDRNLKLKAHIHDVITDKVENFTKWAFADIPQQPQNKRKQLHRTEH